MVQNNYIQKYTTKFEPGCRIFYELHAAAGYLLSIAAEISVEEPLHLLDFGNRCDMYFTARQLRCLTNDPVSAMQNIRLQRAFTCYQALTLLRQMEHMELYRTVIILDLLAPFLDENIKMAEINRLFGESLSLLRLSAQERPVLIGVKPVPKKFASDRVCLVNDLARDFGLITVPGEIAERMALASAYQQRPAVRVFEPVRNAQKTKLPEPASGQTSIFDLLPKED